MNIHIHTCIHICACIHVYVYICIYIYIYTLSETGCVPCECYVRYDMWHTIHGMHAHMMCVM